MIQHDSELRFKVVREEFLAAEETGRVNIHLLAQRVAERLDPNCESPYSMRLFAIDGIEHCGARICRAADQMFKKGQDDAQEKLFNDLYPSSEGVGEYKKIDLMTEADFLHNISSLRRQGAGSLAHADRLEREYMRRKRAGLFEIAAEPMPPQSEFPISGFEI